MRREYDNGRNRKPSAAIECVPRDIANSKSYLQLRGVYNYTLYTKLEYEACESGFNAAIMINIINRFISFIYTLIYNFILGFYFNFFIFNRCDFISSIASSTLQQGLGKLYKRWLDKLIRF